MAWQGLINNTSILQTHCGTWTQDINSKQLKIASAVAFKNKIEADGLEHSEMVSDW